MDVLSQVLAAVRMRGAVFCRAQLRAPWGMAFPEQGSALFHLLERGSGWLSVDGELRRVSGGDFLLFARGQPHALLDAPGTTPVSLGGRLSADRAVCQLIERGGQGPESHLICGALHFDGGPGLLASLPPVIHLRAEAVRGAPGLEALVRLLGAEAGSAKPGTEALCTRLAEALFLEVVRLWLSGEGAGSGAGWLPALRDPRIAEAMGLMRAEPHRAWTLSGLARRVGMSRTVFAERFTALVGEPPLRHLTRCRMEEAARLVRASEAKLEDVAERCGYRSLAAFTKAFRRAHGAPPGTYRRAA